MSALYINICVCSLLCTPKSLKDSHTIVTDAPGNVMSHYGNPPIGQLMGIILGVD